MYMSRMTSLLAAAFLAYAVSTTGARQLQQSYTCPISPTTTKLSFTSLAAGCAAGKDACTSCLCPVITTFSPALTSSATGTALPLTEASSILTACVTAYIAPIIAAGADISTLTSLESCPVSTTDVQDCLGTTAAPAPAGQKVSAATTVKTATTAAGGGAIGGAATAAAAAAAAAAGKTSTAVKPVASPVNATLAIKASPSPAASPLPASLVNNTLRINPGSIKITPTGPTFTVSGSVTNPADLLKLMMNDQSLLAALEPAEIAQLRALYTQLTTVTLAPQVQRALAGLVDASQPINAVALLSDVADLLAQTQDDGGLVPVTNSTVSSNSTADANSTSKSTAPATVISPAPTTSDLTSLSSASAQKALNPVKSGAAATGVSAVANVVVLLAVLLL